MGTKWKLWQSQMDKALVTGCVYNVEQPITVTSLCAVFLGKAFLLINSAISSLRPEWVLVN